MPSKAFLYACHALSHPKFASESYLAVVLTQPKHLPYTYPESDETPKSISRIPCCGIVFFASCLDCMGIF